MVSYFTAQYWYNFNNILADAVEPQSVAMSDAEVSIELGHQMSLSAAVTPNNATPNTVYWASTNTAVATVNSNGLVTAVGTGECYIRATCVDKQAFCHVTISPQRVNITLDKQEARLLPNHTLTLTASCSPAAAELSVTSSDPAVALPRLVNGTIMVVGISQGVATITVSTADGWCNPAECQVTVYTELGDANCDGYINIADVTGMIDSILGDENAIASAFNADTNSDGVIGIADVTSIIDYILAGGIWPWEDPQDDHDWVDLGLPSGTLWATFNVGASAPEDYGDYFAWGETAPKDYIDWSTYKWCNGSYTTMTKYCTNSSYGYNGFTDGKTELDPEDDAAHVNWGPSWRMPTTEQQRELYEKCSSTWTTLNGVSGRLFTGPNGNTLFLPAAGCRWDESLYYAGSHGFYWSRTLNSSYSYIAYGLYFDSNGVDWNDYYRDNGRSVRALRVSQN